MEPLKKQSPISALHEILKWSASQPEWQQDALRRIVVKRTLDQTDIEELDRLCRAKHAAERVKALTVKANPLDASHIPAGPGSEACVTLVSIGNLRGVNRLPSDETIPFGGTPGLAVIYGDNGTGKSGYARVIKKACRTRGAPPEIRSNAFASVPSNPASGTIVCSVRGEDCPLTWKDDAPSDPRLANVLVFDALSADHYLDQDGAATFTPHGLDVLPKLSKACDTINQFIRQDIERIKKEMDKAAKSWKYIPTTSVGKLIVELNDKTKQTYLEVLSGLDEKQAQRLKDLTEALKSDPKQKAKETCAAATRLETFAGQVKEASINLSEERILALNKAIGDTKTKAEAAKAFATGRFDATYLPGTGGELWRNLWEAARLFSVSAAYKDQSFPVTTDAARCLLCQQNLDGLAPERLKAFDAFCKDQTQQLTEEAKMQLKHAQEEVQKMSALSLGLTKIEADLFLGTADQLSSITEFVKNADERLTTVKVNLVKDCWTEPVMMPPSPVDIITTIASALETRAKTEESLDNPDVRKKLEAERDELSDRQWLGGVKDEVLAQIGMYKQVAVLEACLKDTLTTKATTKNTELTKQLVTDAFCERFKSAARGLGLRTIAVKLEEIKGEKGETKFGLRLETTSAHSVKAIASEGEQRCIALAAFLAELSQASHQSALVFDDPVSSFDHRYREKTAARLVEESKIRQVIVFTHDVVFLNDLLAYAIEAGVTTEICHLEWAGNMPGQRVEGLPWDCKSADDRFDKLEKEQRAIAKTWNPVPNEDNVQSIRRAYSWLRATLERIVEKEIFADVVFRYRSYVNIKKLDGVVGFQQSECRELQRLVQRCHDVTDAHDPAPGKQSMIPDPEDLAKDIIAAKQLLSQIRARRKAVRTV